MLLLQLLLQLLQLKLACLQVGELLLLLLLLQPLLQLQH